jgi:Flp pilus assembly protein CpaB
LRGSTYFLVGVLVVSAGVGACLWRRNAISQEVYVATTDLPAYRQITTAEVKAVEMPSREVPEGAVTDLAGLLGRYTLGPAMGGKPLTLDGLGPQLPSAALAGQVIVGLAATTADIAGGALDRADRIRLLLSSTSTDQPRSGVIAALVLDVKPAGGESGRFVVVCAFAEADQGILLAVGGTARIFFVRVSGGTVA